MLPILKIIKKQHSTRIFLDGRELPKTITDYSIKENNKSCLFTVTLEIQKNFTCTDDTGEIKN